MEYLVLDTDVASHLQRRSLPEPLREHLRDTIACVTFITVGEFFKGAVKRGWGERRLQQLEAWLRNVVVLPYTGEISRVWGRVSAECEGKGQPIPPNDAWIAACCLPRPAPHDAQSSTFRAGRRPSTGSGETRLTEDDRAGQGAVEQRPGEQGGRVGSARVIEDGGDEDEAIAAILHDAMEDQGGRP